MTKKVGYCVYAHKSNLAELIQNIDSIDDINFIQNIISTIPYSYDIIKYNKTNGNVSFISCPEWDTVNEPTVEESYVYNNQSARLVKIIKGGKTVYHNKWQFVADNYTGFNIEKAKERTALWNSIPNIKSLKCKIGNKVFWHHLLKTNEIQI